MDALRGMKLVFREKPQLVIPPKTKPEGEKKEGDAEGEEGKPTAEGEKEGKEGGEGGEKEKG